MGLSPITLRCRDLPSAWFEAIDAVLEHGRQYTVEKGSYEGQKRWELDFITLHITYPGTRSLVPEMPPHLSHIPPPAVMTLEEQEETGVLSVEGYLPYLMTGEKKSNEQYTYGERLTQTLWRDHPYFSAVAYVSQVDEVIRRFKEDGYGTNQCSMSISQPSDIHLSDPPCLRELDCRIFPTKGLKDGEKLALHFFPYYRSWDLWGGLPLNLAALRVMQEYMAEAIGVEAGEMICSSKGLHLYDFSWDIAKLRVNR